MHLILFICSWQLNIYLGCHCQVHLPPNGQLQAYSLPPGQNFPVMIPPVGHALPGQPLPASTGPPGFPGVFPPHNAAQQQQVDVMMRQNIFMLFFIGWKSVEHGDLTGQWRFVYPENHDCIFFMLLSLSGHVHGCGPSINEGWKTWSKVTLRLQVRIRNGLLPHKRFLYPACYLFFLIYFPSMWICDNHDMTRVAVFLSRSPKRRRSRSNSRSRWSRHRRSRSRSRDRRHHSPRSRSQERREREKERERRQKGLPPLKSDTLSSESWTLYLSTSVQGDWNLKLDLATIQQQPSIRYQVFHIFLNFWVVLPPRISDSDSWYVFSLQYNSVGWPAGQKDTTARCCLFTGGVWTDRIHQCKWICRDQPAVTTSCGL